MNRKYPRLWLGALVQALAAVLLLTGCDNPIEQAPAAPPTRSKTPPPKVELMSESSPEAMRRHIFDEKGREVTLEIQFRNGDKETQNMRPDGTRASSKLVKPNGTVQSEWQYSPDGKYAVSGYEKRSDGSILREAKKDASGNYVTTVYWWNKAPFSVEVRKSDGSFETTLYWRTGTIAGKRFGTVGGALTAEETYNWSGQKVLRREPAANGEWDVTTYRSDGTARTRIRIYLQPNSWGGTRTVVRWSDEYDSKGQRVVARYTVGADGYSISEVSRVQADGATTVSVLRSNKTVEREEIRDAGGNVLSSKAFGPTEKTHPDIDRSLLSEPYNRDPNYAWKMEEDNSYYRNQTW